MPQGWKNVPEHKGSERWVSPDGKEGLDFDAGRPGETGFEGEDHWHKLKPKRYPPGEVERDTSGGRKGGHYRPGDEVELDNCFILNPKLNQPIFYSSQLDEEYYRNMEKFWGTILVGDVVVGAVLTGGALGGFEGVVGASGASASASASSSGWGLLPAFGL